MYCAKTKKLCITISILLLVPPNLSPFSGCHYLNKQIGKKMRQPPYLSSSPLLLRALDCNGLLPRASIASSLDESRQNLAADRPASPPPPRRRRPPPGTTAASSSSRRRRRPPTSSTSLERCRRRRRFDGDKDNCGFSKKPDCGFLMGSATSGASLGERLPTSKVWLRAALLSREKVRLCTSRSGSVETGYVLK